jgi:hypothetical protein
VSFEQRRRSGVGPLDCRGFGGIAREEQFFGGGGGLLLQSDRFPVQLADGGFELLGRR